MMRFGKILVPVDFWTSSATVVDMAVELAQALDAELTLLHVWDVPGAFYPGMDLAEVEAALAPAREHARLELEKLTADVQRRRPRTSSLLRCGRAANEILRVLADGEHGLVVVGTHGRHGVERFFLGSVAAKVLRAAAVPVLTIPLAPDDVPLPE